MFSCFSLHLLQPLTNWHLLCFQIWQMTWPEGQRCRHWDVDLLERARLMCQSDASFLGVTQRDRGAAGLLSWWKGVKYAAMCLCLCRNVLACPWRLGVYRLNRSHRSLKFHRPCLPASRHVFLQGSPHLSHLEFVLSNRHEAINLSVMDLHDTQ